MSRLSLNQKTTNSWSLREAIDGTVAAGLSSIGIWREPLAEAGLDNTRNWLADTGLRVSSLCRGGFFTAADPAQIEAAHADNLRAIDEAAAIGTDTLCLVPGGLPDGDRDLIGARSRAAEAIGRLVPYARERGVRLGIEPMTLTSELSIRFLRPARGRELRARADLHQVGRRSIVGSVVAWTDDVAKPVAVAQGTYVRPTA